MQNITDCFFMNCTVNSSKSLPSPNKSFPHTPSAQGNDFTLVQIKSPRISPSSACKIPGNLSQREHSVVFHLLTDSNLMWLFIQNDILWYLKCFVQRDVGTQAIHVYTGHTYIHSHACAHIKAASILSEMLLSWYNLQAYYVNFLRTILKTRKTYVTIIKY